MRCCVLLQTILLGACLVSIIQVNTVPTLGLLIFNYRHVFGVIITWGGGGGGGGGGGRGGDIIIIIIIRAC